MKRVLMPRLPEIGQVLDLPEEEAHHLLQVLRVRNGEEVEALDGIGHRQKVEIVLQGKGRASARALSAPTQEPSLLSVPLTLEMAILKGDAMEWVVEKAVELGVRRFQPVITAHAVVQLDRKGPQFFQERWQKIADQALKQCGRLDRMKVLEPKELGEAMQRKEGIRFWLNERQREGRSLSEFFIQKIPAEQDVSILVGPEGGWSESEIAFLGRADLVETSLGPWVLRAETAALFATSLALGAMR